MRENEAITVRPSGEIEKPESGLKGAVTPAELVHAMMAGERITYENVIASLRADAETDNLIVPSVYRNALTCIGMEQALRTPPQTILDQVRDIAATAIVSQSARAVMRSTQLEEKQRLFGTIDKWADLCRLVHVHLPWEAMTAMQRLEPLRKTVEALTSPTPADQADTIPPRKILN